MSEGWTNAKMVDDIDAPDAGAGAFEFFSAGDVPHAGLMFNCPCGCGRQGDLGFRPVCSNPAWDWNGNFDRPTLKPSVRILNPDGTEHWHGWLTAGTWVSA